MPSLKDIRRRITSVKSTQKITRAMKLVAAAKLRRAQENVVQVRPYARKLRDLIGELSVHADAKDHPLLAERPPRRVLLLVLTSDRGLCGGYNTNVLKAVEQYRQQHQAEVEKLSLAVAGKKGQQYFRFRGVPVDHSFPAVTVETALAQARDIASQIVEAYLGASTEEQADDNAPRLDRVMLIYNEFKSAMSQRVLVEQLLPIVPAETSGPVDAMAEPVYEPNKANLLQTILPMWVEYELYRAASEAAASEFGARMTAMENATNNARDMIASLTLQYNKARQAAITKELLEIVAGAEALRG